MLFIQQIEARQEAWGLRLEQPEGTLFMELGAGYYYTNSNYTDYYSSIPLTRELNISQNSHSPPFMHYVMQDLSIGWTLKKWFELDIFAQGFWLAQSGDGSRLLSFNALNNATKAVKRVGMALRSYHTWHKPGGGFIPEFSFSFPLHRMNYKDINYLHTEPIVDDGTAHFTPSFWFFIEKLNLFYPYIHLGAKFRTQSLSSLAQWKLGLMLKWNIMETGLHYYGSWTMIKNTETSMKVRDRKELLKSVNAGSYKFLSENPGVMGFYGWLGLNLRGVSLRVALDKDVFGLSYAKGYSMIFSIVLRTEQQRKIEKLFNNKDHLFKPEQKINPVSAISDDPLLEETPDEEEETPIDEEETLSEQDEDPEDPSSSK